MEFTRQLLVEYKNKLDQIIAEHNRSHALLKQNKPANTEDPRLNAATAPAADGARRRGGTQESPELVADKSSAAGEMGENADMNSRVSQGKSVRSHKQLKKKAGSLSDDRQESSGGDAKGDNAYKDSMEDRLDGEKECTLAHPGECGQMDEKTPGCQYACENIRNTDKERALPGTARNETEYICRAQEEGASGLAGGKAVPRAEYFPQRENVESDARGKIRQIQLSMVRMDDDQMGPACLVDETILEDTTRIQDQSCFMGNETYTLDALAQYRKRRARRRTGRRIQKRRLEALPEFPDVVKRTKTDQAKSYLVEYYQLLSRDVKDQSCAAADKEPDMALLNYEHELTKMKETNRRKQRRMKKLKEKLKEIDLLKERLREMEAAKDREKTVEMERMAEQGKKRMEEESMKRVEELERIKREGLEATRKIEEEMKRLVEFRNEILVQSKVAADHRLEQQVPEDARPQRPSSDCTRKAQANVPASLESKTFIDKNRVPKKGNINDFFKEAKKEHIERINQTMLSRTWISEKSDANKSKATFNSTVHKPKQPIINVDFIKPHNLYKQSIDVQNIQDDPKSYVPRTFIPFYTSEDEFEAEEKKFTNAFFTKDPRLLYSVRKQNHNEIRAFFGSQRDIDVETIFSKVENVTNNSPNKFMRRS